MPTPSSASSSTSSRRRSVTVMALVVVLVGALALGGLSALGGDRSGDSAATGDGRGADEEGQTVQPLPDDHPVHALARRDGDDPLARGDADAPIVMIAYIDFQCALCGRHARVTEPKLVEEYVESGVLRIEFRNFPVFGPESDTAARAAWAAGEQGMFWEFYTVAFSEDAHQHSGRFDEEGVMEIAEEAGVTDLDRFAEDLDSEEAGKAVERDAEEGFGLGVTTTPAFLVNGHPLVGAQPVETFRETIDQLLAARR
ncbi:hypothetical protein GCM10009716_31750 [Streptomyces sodiiphilus]|uniref:Thioredoxin domain-containing protein n=1 Tax=Streptomyces sodiiphilus TaxID=226217 RepID=A0ABN2PHV3_9ACTN